MAPFRPNTPSGSASGGGSARRSSAAPFSSGKFISSENAAKAAKARSDGLANSQPRGLYENARARAKAADQAARVSRSANSATAGSLSRAATARRLAAARTAAAQAAARSVAANSAAVAAKTSAGTAGVVSRTPVIGAIAAKVSPYIKGGAPFIALAALSAIPAAMEVFAPGVQSWLLGGWRGDGKRQATVSQAPASAGQCSVQYAVRGNYSVIRGDGAFLAGSSSQLTVFGPISQIRHRKTPFPWAPTQYSFEFYFLDGGGSERSLGSFNGGGFPANELTFNAASFTQIQRLDGLPDTCAPPPVFTPAPLTQNPKPSNPLQLPSPPSADNARNAALGAVAATLIAQRTATTVPSTRNLGGNQQRPIGSDLGSSSPPPPTSSRPCQGNACGQAALDQSTKNGEDLSKILDLLNALGIEDMKKKLDVIDDKIGAQIFDGNGNKVGLAGAALQTFERLNKVGDYLRFDRIMNVLTFITTVHNAAMLSRNLGETLAQAISNGLAAIGIRDVDNNPLQIGNIIGKSVEGMITSAIGAENYQALNATWKKANRIYQASANLLNNIQSLRYSITGALETIGGWNARIGNALKRFGVVGDSAYSWMNPNPNFDNQWMRSLETIENAVSSIDSVASEILSAQETVNEITRAKTELETAVTAGTEKPQLENTQQKNKATAAKSASASPNINPEDTVKPST